MVFLRRPITRKGLRSPARSSFRLCFNWRGDGDKGVRRVLAGRAAGQFKSIARGWNMKRIIELGIALSLGGAVFALTATVLADTEPTAQPTAGETGVPSPAPTPGRHHHRGP